MALDAHGLQERPACVADLVTIARLDQNDGTRLQSRPMAIDDGNTRPVDDVELLVGAFVKVVGATSLPPTANTMTAAYDLAFDADRRKPGRKLSWSLLMVFSSQWQAQAERVNGRRFTWQRISRETSHAWHPRMQPPKAVAISSKEAMTNCHVVARAKTIALANTTTTLPAEVIAADCKTDRCYLSVRRRSVLDRANLARIHCVRQADFWAASRSSIAAKPQLGSLCGGTSSFPTSL